MRHLTARGLINPMAWNTQQIPDLSGRIAVVTGATSGLGLASARELAAHGAHVVMTARDPGRGEQAVATVMAAVPSASVEVRPLDTSSLDSVRAFAAAWDGPLDILLNNAGVMAVPYSLSPDGFELHIATNHLGHFALTGLLLPALESAPTARVVTVSSQAAKQAATSFDDLVGDTDYDKWKAYARSKLANLLFAIEFQRRLTVAGSSISSLAAHPGLASTNLFTGDSGAMTSIVKIVGQSPDAGALPQLRAATDPNARGGEYYGPSFIQLRGAPKKVTPGKAAADPDAARALWSQSESLTGVVYAID